MLCQIKEGSGINSQFLMATGSINSQIRSLLGGQGTNAPTPACHLTPLEGTRRALDSGTLPAYHSKQHQPRAPTRP